MSLRGKHAENSLFLITLATENILCIKNMFMINEGSQLTDHLKGNVMYFKTQWITNCINVNNNS